jgi:hypothetical protein
LGWYSNDTFKTFSEGTAGAADFEALAGCVGAAEVAESGVAAGVAESGVAEAVSGLGMPASTVADAEAT